MPHISRRVQDHTCIVVGSGCLAPLRGAFEQ